MKMCLAPCFKGCTDDEYAAEVGRVQQFFQSSGHSLIREIEQQRDEASSISTSKVQPRMHVAPRQGEGRRRAVAGDRSPTRRAERGDDPAFGGTRVGGAVQNRRRTICEAVALNVANRRKRLSPPSRSRWSRASAIRWRRLKLPSARRARVDGALALLKRWYYRTSKVGELFLTDGNGELPMRRVVHGVSRVFRGEKPAAISARPQATTGNFALAKPESRKTDARD